MYHHKRTLKSRLFALKLFWGDPVRIFVSLIAAILLVSSTDAFASTTRIKLHFNSLCAYVVDVDISDSHALLSEEPGDGCSPDDYYGIGTKAKVKGMGSAVLLGAANPNQAGFAIQILIQHPFVSGGTVEMDGTSQDHTVGFGIKGIYTVLK